MVGGYFSMVNIHKSQLEISVKGPKRPGWLDPSWRIGRWRWQRRCRQRCWQRWQQTCGRQDLWLRSVGQVLTERLECCNKDVLWCFMFFDDVLWCLYMCIISRDIYIYNIFYDATKILWLLLSKMFYVQLVNWTGWWSLNDWYVYQLAIWQPSRLWFAIAFATII